MIFQVPVNGIQRRLLEDLARLGIYGLDEVNVIQRFIDEGLQRFVDKPILRDGRGHETPHVPHE